MRIAVAGMGLRAGHVLSLMKQADPDIEFVGYYDPQPSHLAMIGLEVRAFPSIEIMLEQTNPDLLFIASPNRFHLEQIEIGLRKGVRIFAEKPIVCTFEETFYLTKLLAEYGTDQVLVGLVLRYAPQIKGLQNFLPELGTIVSLEANEHIAPYHGAFFMRDWRRLVKNSGGFMLEKCCHDLDIYNMVTASRPLRVASFGGRGSFVPENRPVDYAENQIMHVKPSVWDKVDDPFKSDGDIIDFQTAILTYESGASLTFHTNSNVPDEQRRFCIIGNKGMAEGDFVRDYLKIIKRDGSRLADRSYHNLSSEESMAHYGADHQMVSDILAHLRGHLKTLPVSVVDALEAGITAMALDEARKSCSVVELEQTWARFDDFGLRSSTDPKETSL